MEEKLIFSSKHVISVRIDLTSGESRHFVGVDTITENDLYVYLLRYGVKGNVIDRRLKSDVEKIWQVLTEQVWP